MHKKTKGSIWEMIVASKLLKMGWNVLFPFGENNRYDLVAEKNSKFVKVQVKYVTPRKGVLDVNCRSSNNWSIDKYTPRQVDFIAAYDSKNNGVYFIPSEKFNATRIKLRVKPTKNKQELNIKYAKDFINFR
ncbi:MAG: hypothetical protein HZA30_03790 [Candidatus Omnitrophica bacterium]|nr:hypothetical protein [Candidatus Omnitrophota bacterium]